MPDTKLKRLPQTKKSEFCERFSEKNNHISGALTYAELGTMMPESGGEYLYIRRGFGGLVGYLYAFMNVTIIKPRKGAGSWNILSPRD